MTVAKGLVPGFSRSRLLINNNPRPETGRSAAPVTKLGPDGEINIA